MNLNSTNVLQNEILKAVDVNGGFDASIENITKTIQAIFENEKDFVVGKSQLLKYHSQSENDWNLTLSPIVGVCKSTGIAFLETEEINVSVAQPENGVARRDIIEIQGSVITNTPQQRSFIDFNTKTTSIIEVDTKKVLTVNVHAKQTETIGSVQPPNHTAGWVKIAEIYIPGDATKISDCTLYNITSNYGGQVNTDWQVENTATYNMGYISELNEKMSVIHNADGSLKNGIVKSSNISFGNTNTDVNGTKVPSGSEISVNGVTYPNTTAITTIISTIASKVSDIFNAYLKYGEYQLKGELGISETVTSGSLTEAIKVGAAGDGTAYIKVGDKVVMNIIKDGSNYSIQATQGYSSANENAFIRKIDVATLLNVDDYPTEDSPNLVTSGGVYEAFSICAQKVLLTQAEYDALETKDPNIIYCITDASPAAAKNDQITVGTNNDALTDSDAFLSASLGTNPISMLRNSMSKVWTYIYNKIKSNVNGDDIHVTYEEETDTLNNTLPKLGKVKTVNDTEPDEDGNIEIDANETITITNNSSELTDNDSMLSGTAGSNPTSMVRSTLSALWTYIYNKIKSIVTGDDIQVTYEETTDSLTDILPLVGKVKTVNDTEPDEDGNIEIETGVVNEFTQAQYDALPTATKMDGKMRCITDARGVDLFVSEIDDTTVTEEKTWSSNKISKSIDTYVCESAADEDCVIEDDSLGETFRNKQTIKVLFLNGHYGDDFTLNDVPIYVSKDGVPTLMSSVSLDRAVASESTQNWYCQEFVTLEMMYLQSLNSGNGGLLVINNPIVLSKNDSTSGYTIYANGRYGYIRETKIISSGADGIAWTTQKEGYVPVGIKQHNSTDDVRYIFVPIATVGASLYVVCDRYLVRAAVSNLQVEIVYMPL